MHRDDDNHCHHHHHHRRRRRTLLYFSLKALIIRSDYGIVVGKQQNHCRRIIGPQLSAMS
jgi:hypothetical protein